MIPEHFYGKLLFVLLLLTSATLTGQDQPDTTRTALTWIIIKNDNSQYIGEIISQDAWEVLINTENLGKVAIPKHEIKEIRELQPDDFRQDLYVGEELFATRYFLTTNGLPVRKGENYIQWNLFGPDFQFGVSDNFGLGIMTSWIAIPVIGTAKYSKQLGEKTSFAIGGLLGTGSWAQPDFGLALPFVAITYGTRSHNINFSTGYGYLFYSREDYNYQTDRETKTKYREGRLLLSFGAMTKVSQVVSLVFDSFITPQGPYQERSEWNYDYENDRYTETIISERSSSLMVFCPGIRLQTRPRSAFQFGFAGVRTEGKFMPVQLPMIQWYRQL
jgi:hypothetical protein